MTVFVGATGRMPFSAFLAYFSAVGVTDLVPQSEKIKKLENSKTHFIIRWNWLYWGLLTSELLDSDI
ncbi:unnamed protein product [Acanthoscelides obtectus]|uniref:Uncharacterized protein n=1 Tax=Acanthoscelides obtectus TaxID=200917 RepID=A0A9P0PJ96_ACAOB|nr:unnamed protein product [Acanthoscelides obtectus]CAK1630095.1 hypothetical protein AOBTE_LOCUS6150 [Acanthoscelides obtectus]